jgi:hypothetical protein
LHSVQVDLAIDMKLTNCKGIHTEFVTCSRDIDKFNSFGMIQDLILDLIDCLCTVEVDSEGSINFDTITLRGVQIYICYEYPEIDYY